MKKILIVEDDRDLNESIAKFLTMRFFECVSVFDGQEAVDLVYEKHFDIIILDVKLPSMNGFSVAKEIRSFSNVPIIFLTSLSSQEYIERGFLQGGDDYITKPFSLNELYLRINAIIKRVYKNETIITISSDTYFNLDNQTLYKKNRPVHLTQKELALLKLFLQNPNKIFSKDEIFNHIYEYDEEPSDASLRVFITTLRKIIGKNKIETIKNVGYRYIGWESLFEAIFIDLYHLNNLSSW